MEYISYTRETLAGFVTGKQFSALRNIPISRHRAESQIHNPRALDSDVLLIAAYDAGELAGYLGLLPDLITGARPPARVAWMSCLWVSEMQQGKGIARALLERAAEAWDNRLCATRMVPWLEPVYQRAGIFRPTYRQPGVRVYLRFPLAEILPPRRTIFSRMRPVLRTLDAVGNLFHDPLLRLRNPAISTGLRVIRTESFDETHRAFIDERMRSEWMRRGADDLEWIIRNPWILEGRDPDSSRYYFTSHADRFEMRALKIIDEQESIVASLLVQLRNDRMAVPYCRVSGEKAESVAELLYQIAREERISSIASFHPRLAPALMRLRAPFIYRHPTTRPWMFPSNINIDGNPVMQDGDGDSAFT